MGQYADRLSNLELLLQLQKSAGRDDLSATDVTALTSMVYVAADTVGPLLGRIPQTFAQYTEHDIGHSANIIYLAGKFIPAETLERLNGLELAMLLLAALLHDVGMYVEDKEKDEAIESREFLAFSATHERSAALGEARKAGQVRHAERIRDALLADYFRHLHPERAGQHIRKYLNGKLVFREIDISEHVIRLCESHAWGTLESNDPRKPEKMVAKLDTRQPLYGVTVNLQYLACCLRLADIMDFDRSRTPLAVFQTVDFTEGKSWEEWNKHLQVSGWIVNEHEVQFATDCTHPTFFVAVMEFLDWIDTELKECRQLLVKEAPKGVAERYLFHLPPVVDRFKVEMADKRYVAGAFRFQLEYDRIMRLLMDKSLYPDPSLFLRELLQNSLDACRNREAIAKSVGADKWYQPKISVWDHSADLQDPRIIFQDNGIGMSRRILESYFMRVGRSYYKSAEFDAERQRLREKGIELVATSQFGIGILSCFMVADRLEVETYRKGNKPLHVTIEGATKYFLVELLDEPEPSEFPTQADSDAEDGPPNFPGTRITLHLRSDATIRIHQVLGKFAVNAEYNITIYSSKAALTIPQRRWEAEDIASRSLEGAIGPHYHYYSTSPSVATIAKYLREVLAPLRIEFSEFSSTKDLRGSAWLWLLRGRNDTLCPEAGFLAVSSTSIHITGLPAVIGRLQDLDAQDLPGWEDLLISLESNLGTAQTPFLDYLFLREEDFNRPNYEYSGLYTLDEEWSALSKDEQIIACQFLNQDHMGATPWYTNKDVLRELRLGTHAWINDAIDFKTPAIPLRAEPQAMALCGILLPGGIVRWDPMNGSAEKDEMLDLPGGLYVDAHGANAPVPAASRLFIDIKEAQKVRVPLARAFFQAACNMASQASFQCGWEAWLNGFVQSSMGRWIWPDRDSWDIDSIDDIFPATGKMRAIYEGWKRRVPRLYRKKSGA